MYKRQKEGIKLISVNLLMDNEEDPVIWRGPVIAGVVKQFWNETASVSYTHLKYTTIFVSMVRLFFVRNTFRIYL